MDSILLLIKKIKNLIPYFILIAIYFFFVNLEASNNKLKNKKNIETKLNFKKDKSKKKDFKSNNLKISIPVVPFKQ